MNFGIFLNQIVCIGIGSEKIYLPEALKTLRNVVLITLF